MSHLAALEALNGGVPVPLILVFNLGLPRSHLQQVLLDPFLPLHEHVKNIKLPDVWLDLSWLYPTLSVLQLDGVIGELSGEGLDHWQVVKVLEPVELLQVILHLSVLPKQLDDLLSIIYTI